MNPTSPANPSSVSSSIVVTRLPFVAELVFADDGWWTVESRCFHATHPAIAYQLAVASGSLKDYGRRFLGLADLRIRMDGEVLGGMMKKGDAKPLVVQRDDLPIFTDPRWRNVSHNPAEMDEAFRQLPMAVDLPGVDDIQWDQLSHAYGSAKDVPHDLKQLASMDHERSQKALGSLYASILHQGSVYNATVFALPFIVRIASSPDVLNRKDVIEFLWFVAESTNVEEIRRYLFHRCNIEDDEDDDLSDVVSAREQLTRHLSQFRLWLSDPDTLVANAANRLVNELTRELEPEIPCPSCGKPLRSANAKQCFKCGADWH